MASAGALHAAALVTGDGCRWTQREAVKAHGRSEVRPPPTRVDRVQGSSEAGVRSLGHGSGSRIPDTSGTWPGPPRAGLRAEWAEHRGHRAGVAVCERQVRMALCLLACGLVTNSCLCDQAGRLWKAANPHAPQTLAAITKNLGVTHDPDSWSVLSQHGHRRPCGAVCHRGQPPWDGA